MSFDKEKYTEQLKNKKAELQKQIEEIAKNFVDSPEQLAELAAFQARFYNYSYKNTLLIMSQNQYASFVASFNRFKAIGDDLIKEYHLPDKYLGVKKGASGMQIYVPVETTMICTDPTKNIWIPISKATPEEKIAATNKQLETRKKLGFKLGTVFDISQTNIPSEYYPKIFSPGYDSELHSMIIKGLKHFIETKMNCPVSENIDNTISLRGCCYTDVNKICLNVMLKDTQKLSTLAHEFGHFLMHNDISNTMPKELKEIEADIFSIMLEAHFGIETNDVRKSHLADNYRSYVATIPDGSEKAAVIEQAFTHASKIFANTIRGIEKSIQSVINESKLIEPITITADGEKLEFKTFAAYANWLMLPEPTYVNVSNSTESIAAAAINKGANPFSVYRALEIGYRYDDNGLEYVEMKEGEEAEAAVQQLLQPETECEIEI